MLTRSLLLLALASPLAAQARHPDFSGTWTLDAMKSSAEGNLPVPSAATYVVRQVGDSIAVDETTSDGNGDVTAKKVWRVDGKSWTNYMTYQGTSMTLNSVLSWSDAVLNVRTTSDFQGTPVEQVESWSLSADGKVLTHRVSTTVNGEVFATLNMVLVKK